MRSASIRTSDRLRKALKVLQEAERELSTLELMQRAEICAVSAVVDELRDNVAEIIIRYTVENGKYSWFFTLVKSPEGY